MDDMVKSETYLPVSVEKLIFERIVGKEKLKAYRALLRASELTGTKQAKGSCLEDAQDLADYMLDIDVRLGELLKGIEPKRAKEGNSQMTSLQSLPDGISKQSAYLVRTLSANPAVVEQVKAEARDKGFIATADHVYKIIKNPHVFHNSGDNEWYTPGEYIEAARNTMGSIDLDPASSDIANRTVKATKFFKSEEDGRVQEWRGNVFMNPPYAQPLIANFCNTLIKYIHSRTVSQAVVLVNNATETTWFQNLISEASAVCFPEGRVRFLDKDGNPGAPLQGQAVVYFGQNINGFIKQFSHFGVVCNVVER